MIRIKPRIPPVQPVVVEAVHFTEEDTDTIARLIAVWIHREIVKQEVK